MRTVGVRGLLVAAALLAGCATPPLRPVPGMVQRCRFVSQRDIGVTWPASNRAPGGGETRARESLELIVAYRLDAVAPNGVTTWGVVCESAVARRTRFSGQADPRRDAVEALAGRRFTLTVDPNGRVRDRDGLGALIREVAAGALRDVSGQGRLKDPEMIWDAITLLWCESEGVPRRAHPAVGDRWTARLPVPTPWMSRRARELTYTLDHWETGPAGRVAVIHSTQALSPEPAPRTWPIPFAGRLRPTGTFGFLRGHQILSLEGEGTDRWSAATGRPLGYEHRYRLESQAFAPLNLSAPVRITVDQVIRLETLAPATTRKDD